MMNMETIMRNYLFNCIELIVLLIVLKVKPSTLKPLLNNELERMSRVFDSFKKIYMRMVYIQVYMVIFKIFLKIRKNYKQLYTHKINYCFIISYMLIILKIKTINNYQLIIFMGPLGTF